MLVKLRRKQLMAKAFPVEWENILKQNLPQYRHLSDMLKKQLHRRIHVFLNEKNFEGCGGLELTEEIKVTIAAQACILLLNRKTEYYPRLSSILVYPGAYVAESGSFIGGQYVRGKSVRLGESWHRGVIVLAWDHVKHGTIDFGDSHNVALHEFAHQLDQENGEADGMPSLDRKSSCITWARILGREYKTLQKNVRHCEKTVIDDYGATDPAEFFAVVTETFFEKPKQMKEKHPDLYRELKNYYKLDPAEWDFLKAD